MRTYLIKSSILLCLLVGASSYAETVISKINITYSQLLLPADRQGFVIPQAVIGGNVQFTGTAPVYVTLLIAGQSYNAPTDALGNFSFLAFAANAGNYEVRAWTPDVAQDGSSTGSQVVVHQNLIVINH